MDQNFPSWLYNCIIASVVFQVLEEVLLPQLEAHITSFVSTLAYSSMSDRKICLQILNLFKLAGDKQLTRYLSQVHFPEISLNCYQLFFNGICFLCFFIFLISTGEIYFVLFWEKSVNRCFFKLNDLILKNFLISLGLKTAS